MINLNTCARCQTKYDWHKSSSTLLKMTYCGFLCEKSDLGGFTLDDLFDEGEVGFLHKVRATHEAAREMAYAANV